jgi:hypothetical protein
METSHPDAQLLRGAGIAAIAGAVLLVVTAILLFAGVMGLTEAFGRATGLTDALGWANDVVVAVAMLMLGPAIVATHRLGWPRVRRWFDVLSWLALAGIVVFVAGQLLLVVGVIRIGPAFLAVGTGISAVLAWGIGYAMLAWQGHREVASVSVARWALASAVSFVASAITWPTLGIAAWSVVGVALLISFVGWWATLGRDLVRRSRGVGGARETSIRGRRR